MSRSTAVTILCTAILAATAPRAAQVVIDEQRVVTQLPGAAGGRGGAPPPLALGTGLIVGQVVEGETTTPVPGGLVTLMLPGATPLRVLADGQGRFAFRQLPKGRYNITVAKAGYVDGGHGRVRPNGPTQPIDLDDGERVGSVSIPIWKYAAVAGYVQDESGDPVIGAQVRVLRRSIVGGQWQLVPGPTDTTDDRGAYRIGSLEPGEYVVVSPMSQPSPVFEMFSDGPREAPVAGAVAVRVAATSAAAGGGGPIRIDTVTSGSAMPPPDVDGRPRVYPTVFYPAASTSARATAITVGSGEERTGVDFQLTPVRTIRVTGVVTGPEGPAGNMTVTLVPSEAGDLATALETLRTSADASGNFSFAAVPAGQYTLQASRLARGGPMEVIMSGSNTMVMTRVVAAGRRGGGPPLPDEPTYWAEAPVAVGEEDIENLAIVLRPGLKVTGQVQFDGTAARPSPEELSSVSVWLEPADQVPGTPRSVARGRVDPSGTFETVGVPAGRYFVRVGGAPGNWHFRGALAGGVDAADRPLDLDGGDVSGVMLTFTDRPSALSGQVTDRTTADGPVTVLVFPADSSAWMGYGSSPRRLRSVPADANGSYQAANLPPGEYLVAAVPDRLAGEWQNPAFLESLAGSATRVRVGNGEQVTQNVQVVR